MAYCSYTDIYNITNITENDISSSVVTTIISEATKQLNQMINVRVTREEVSYIDEIRTNYINGTNKTFYVQNCIKNGKYIADMDNDGSVENKIVQPSSSVNIAVVSTNNSDDAQVTIYGIVDGDNDYETIQLNGTSYVESNKQFSTIWQVVLSETTNGNISVVNSSGHDTVYVTLTSGTSSVTNVEDIIVYAVDTTNKTEEIAYVKEIDATNGKFVLGKAYPSNYKLYVTYEYSYKDESIPDPLVKLACVLLSSAYCYAKLNIGMAPQQSWGNVRFYRHMDSYVHYYNRFLNIVNEINSTSINNKEYDKE